ncbi:MAG: MobC family plasmid mobilization relaxosome protein [Lachnospiraceae bacterium]|nr:MobC family plasmid mobilization relaxosome protein [Lachnospiraceae bacterium]
MNKVKRRRNHAVTIRMSESEYNDFINKVNESGLSQQTYFINAVRGATITPSDEINVLKEISKTFANLERQLRGLATNVNQMAHIANGSGVLPTENDLDRVSDQLNNYRRESESVWQSIRSLIGQQRRTEQ